MIGPGRTLPPQFQPQSDDDAHRECERLRIANAQLSRQVEEMQRELADLRRDMVRMARESGPIAAVPRQPPAAEEPVRAARAEAPSFSSFDAPRPAFEPSFPSFEPAGVAQADQGIDFGAVSRLSNDQLDGLPYGLITLDAQGRVIHYNDTESRLVGLPKDRVIGRSFFGDIAPCTRVREFEGRFRELVSDPTRVRVQSFDFVFRFRRSEQHVSIVMTPARTRGQFHIALVRRAIVPTS